MSEIFDDTIMRQILGQYIPNGESLLAGIHAVSQETNIIGVFNKCSPAEDRLIPDESEKIIALNKKKYGAYDTMKNGSSFKLMLPKLGGLG